MREILLYIALSFITIIAWVLLCNSYRKVPAYTDDNCIRAIVGEYAEDDYYGMLLMAHAIRNRKTLQGVYGYHAKHVLHESKKIWQMASLAWFDSLTEVDPLRGANEWRSEEDIEGHGNPQGFQLVKIYDGTYFYKPLSNSSN